MLTFSNDIAFISVGLTHPTTPTGTQTANDPVLRPSEHLTPWSKSLVIVSGGAFTYDEKKSQKNWFKGLRLKLF